MASCTVPLIHGILMTMQKGIDPQEAKSIGSSFNLYDIFRSFAAHA
jgi:hypothetical protein